MTLSVSVIIPLSLPLSERRKTCLEYTLFRLNRAFSCEAVYLAFGGEGEPFTMKGAESVKVADTWNKSHVLNQSAQLCRSEFVFFLDGDMVLDWDFIQTKCSKLGSIRFCKPFGQLFRLGAEGTARLLAGKGMRKVDFEPAKSVPGGGAFLCRRDLFESLRGFDESFDRGFEDAEFAARLKRFDDVQQWSELEAWHLHHIRPDRPNAELMRRVLARQKLSDKEALQVIQSPFPYNEDGAISDS